MVKSMNKILALSIILAIGVIMLTSATAPALADKDNNNGKDKGCENANEKSKAREKNPHCASTGADLEITGPEVSEYNSGRGHTYFITVTNNGPETAENVVVTATKICSSETCEIFTTVTVIPPIGDDGIIEAGESVIYRIDVSSILTGTSVLTSVTSDTDDPDESNNSLTTTLILLDGGGGA